MSGQFRTLAIFSFGCRAGLYPNPNPCTPIAIFCCCTHYHPRPYIQVGETKRGWGSSFHPPACLRANPQQREVQEHVPQGGKARGYPRDLHVCRLREWQDGLIDSPLDVFLLFTLLNHNSKDEIEVNLSKVNMWLPVSFSQFSYEIFPVLFLVFLPFLDHSLIGLCP